MSVAERRRPRILVVDDEDLIRTLLRRRLSAEGYDIEVAEDGAEAVARCEREFFNLILTDIKMPGLDGIQVLKRTKAAHEDSEVIIMTAYASTETAIEAVRAGAFDYIRKPFDHVDDVVHKVRLALQHQKLALQNREMLKKLDEMNRGLKQMVVSRTRELNEVQDRLEAENRELREAARRFDPVADRLRPALESILAGCRALKEADPGAGGMAEPLRRHVDSIEAEAAGLLDLFGPRETARPKV